MWRALGIVLLAIGVAGFGLCALCSGAYGVMVKADREVFLAMSVGMVVLTLLCIYGIKYLNRKLPKGPVLPPAPEAPPRP